MHRQMKKNHARSAWTMESSQIWILLIAVECNCRKAVMRAENLGVGGPKEAVPLWDDQRFTMMQSPLLYL